MCGCVGVFDFATIIMHECYIRTDVSSRNEIPQVSQVRSVYHYVQTSIWAYTQRTSWSKFLKDDGFLVNCFMVV